jgi:hypothetical protein
MKLNQNEWGRRRNPSIDGETRAITRLEAGDDAVKVKWQLEHFQYHSCGL